jgi:hypothetical protein
MRFLLFSALLLLISLRSHAQLGGISDLSGGGGGGGDAAEACGACAGCLLQGVPNLINLGMLIGRAQRKVLDKRGEQAEIVSLEGIAQVGYFPQYNTTGMVRRVRANWGIFSTDLRYMNGVDATGVVSSVDWQALQLNLANTQRATFRLGGGFTAMHTPIQRVYGELGAMLELRQSEGRVREVLEVRSGVPASFWEIFSPKPRFEASFRVDSRIQRVACLDLRPSVGVFYQRYYNNASSMNPAFHGGIDFLLLQAGMSIIVHR